MDLEQFKNKIKELEANAMIFDILKDYQKSFDLYKQAANQINIFIKSNKNLSCKEKYVEKAKNFILRAKEIKEKINLPSNKVQEIPKVKWEDIVGLEKAKEALKEAAIFPVKFPKLFQGKRKPYKGILLYGIPGTGKSLLAKAVETEIPENFIYVSCANIVSIVIKCMGELELLIKYLFDLARKKKPAIIFFDEIDSIMGRSPSRFQKELLIQMEDKSYDNEEILVLGATNIPWGLDPAIIKIFQKKIYIPLPEFDDRIKLIQLNLKDFPNTLNDQQLKDLAQITSSYSCNDIVILCLNAGFEPVRKCQEAEYFKKIPGNNEFGYNYVLCSQNDPGAMKMTLSELPEPKALLPPKVEFEDFKKCLSSVRCDGFGSDFKKFEEFNEEFGQED